MWKDIKGWESYYEVNEYGEVRNKLNQKLIIGDCNNIGYQRVTLSNKNNHIKKQRFFRHRLVAIHFIETQTTYQKLITLMETKRTTILAT